MIWILSYLSLFSVSRDSLHSYLIMRRLKLVEKEQTVDKEGWLKLQRCVKISFLFDFKCTVSPSPCLASNTHFRAHSVTLKLSHKTLTPEEHMGWWGWAQRSHPTARPDPSLKSSSASLGLANPRQSHSALAMFLLKPLARGTTLANSCGSRLKKKVACLKPAGLKKTAVFWFFFVLFKASVTFY